MTLSPYLAGIRAKVGHDLLVLPSVAVVVQDERGRVLLVRDRRSGGWSLPAGAIEPSESPSDAARRELLEEAGMEVPHLDLVAGLGGKNFRHTYPNGDEVEYSLFVFRASLPKGARLSTQDQAEIAETRFFERSTAPDLALPYPQDLLWGEDDG